MKTTKNSLFTSLVALLVIFSMFVGTTLAWFTDIAESKDNVIQAGALDIDLMKGTKTDTGWVWSSNNGKAIFDYDKWEPGYTTTAVLAVQNNGSLNAKWSARLRLNGKATILADVIDVYVTSYHNYSESRPDFNDGTWQKLGTVADIINNDGLIIEGGLIEPGHRQPVLVALQMRTDAGNDYQGLDLGANFDIVVIATQATGESDSFDDQYDSNATWPYYGLGYQATKPVSNMIDSATGVLSQDVTVGDATEGIYAQAPSGVKLADGANALTLTVEGLYNSNSGISATHRSEVVRSVDVHMDGVAADNTVPMIIYTKELLPAGLNSNNVKLYHVENGETKEMTLVANPVNHNEFSYDPATGDVVMALASFSEIVTYGETAKYWDGTVDTNWYVAGKDVYEINNAEQLAAFRATVDGGYYDADWNWVEMPQDNFEGKTVRLNANINLQSKDADGNITENLFDPIGWGYDYDGFTKDGKTFNGTFDGNNKIIFGLYQNGWDLDPDKANYSTYTYSMAGGGLFASVVDATIKNLTISGADIVFECVDMGVLVGYAQGNCTFDNIAIVNCTIQNYNRYTGGVVGECSPRYEEYVEGTQPTAMHSNHVFNNIRVDSTTTVSSLWGSFDTSLGGILGGKWDKNGAQTKVAMTNCHVAAKIDTFNDVTSAYQWYAYRRAGMLIGNTEQSENHQAKADFLTCEGVYVYYGSWNDYHYCEFENQSDAQGNSSSWNRYPWVRVESGLSCNAYSNPRYGHPIVNGTAIVDSIHSHAGDDQCMVSLPFRQLYGGGQGVYGATEHVNEDGTIGVKEGAYTVTYVNYGETIKVEFVGDNTIAHTLWDYTEYVYGDENVSPIGWVDGNGNVYTKPNTMTIDEGNKKNIILYPKWAGEFTIRFLDAEGNVIYYEIFKEGQSHTLNTDAVEAARLALQNKIDEDKDAIIIAWNTDLSTINFASATGDIIVNAEYDLANTKIKLEPVYENGKLVAFAFAGYDHTDNQYANIVIPPHVGVTPIVEIKNEVFAGYTNLVSVEIPETITSIGSNAFEDGPGVTTTSGRSTITIYFDGKPGTWKKYMDNYYKNDSQYTSINTLGTYEDDFTILTSGWDSGLGDGSRIFFLDGDGNVDNTCYWELYHKSEGGVFGIGAKHYYIWVYHEHSYTNGAAHSGCNKPVSSKQYTNYITDQLNNADRPDKKYWVD